VCYHTSSYTCDATPLPLIPAIYTLRLSNTETTSVSQSVPLLQAPCLWPPLFLASLRFCVHYSIDRDIVQKKTLRFARFFSLTVHNKLENDLETSNKQTNVIDSTMRMLVTHTNTHTHTNTRTDTHTRCACMRVCVCVCVCVHAWACMHGCVCVCVGG